MGEIDEEINYKEESMTALATRFSETFLGNGLGLAKGTC